MSALLRESVSLFAPAASAAFAGDVAAALGIPLGGHEELVFDGGEYKLRPRDSVRGRSVYVVQELFGDALGSANDRLCSLLLFIGALKDAGARRVSACIPYLAYARQDRRTAARDPVATRYIARLFEAVDTDRVIALEVHNRAAFDNAFRCEAVHLEAAALFARHFSLDSDGHDYAVATPDIGGANRARHVQELLQTALGRAVKFAIIDKKRGQGGLVSGDLFAGDVAGRRVIIVDDLISSGTTVVHAIDACRRAGATRVDVAATHASFAPAARRVFDSGKPDSVVVTDSVPLGDGFSAYLKKSLTVLTIAPAFAEAIRRLEMGGSLSDLGGL